MLSSVLDDEDTRTRIPSLQLNISISPTVFLIQQMLLNLTKTYSLFTPTISSEAFLEGLSPGVSLVLARRPVTCAIFFELTGSESKNSVQNAMNYGRGVVKRDFTYFTRRGRWCKLRYTLVHYGPIGPGAGQVSAQVHPGTLWANRTWCRTGSVSSGTPWYIMDQ